MKGLDVSVIPKSEAFARDSVCRIDPEYFAKANLTAAKRLEALPCKPLRDLAFVTDGIHASIEFAEGSGVRVISAKHPKENLFDLSTCEEIAPKQHALNPRTTLQISDVIVSTVGTIGNAAVVTSDVLPANSDRHVGIIRCKPELLPEFLSTFLLSKYGRFQTTREATGNVQLNLFISKIGDLAIPRLSSGFELAVVSAVTAAQRLFRDAENTLAENEEILTTALGLGNWHPPEPLTYIRRASESFAAKRLDSDYFSPRVTQLLARLGASGRTVRDVAPPRQEKFTPATSGDFRYIEISDVRSDGTTTCESVPMREAPSRATWRVHGGDVLTSTVRPIRRLSALVMPEQDGCIASSGFVVLEPCAVPAEVLLTYLRLPLFCELMDLHTSASLYPAISETDLLRLPFPNIPSATCDAIVQSVRSAHTARARARTLLDGAKRAVEIAIEESETKALSFLNS